MPQTSPMEQLDIPEVSLFDFIFGDLAEEDKDLLAIADSVSQLTYGELKQAVELYAGALAARGITKGDVVALQCPNSTAFAVAFHGILRTGATVTTVPALSTAEDIERQLKISGAKMLLTTASVGWAGAVAAGRAGLDTQAVLGVTGLSGIEALIAEGHQPPAVEITPDDLAVIPFSSGTTGVPKGVMLTHGNLVANCYQVSNGLRDDLPRGTRIVTVLPFFHIYGMTVLLNSSLRNRTTQYTFGKFSLPEFLGVIETKKVEFAYIAPPIAVALAKHPIVDQFDLSSLRKCMSGAAALQLELAQALETRLDCEIAQGYGMTEASPVTHVRLGQEAPLDSIGLAVSNTSYKLVDVDTESLDEIEVPTEGRSKPGELWVRGPQVMKGYLNNQEATDSTLVDGWLRTGDLAVMDTDANVFIVDRFKELIKYKGYQVPPAEIEDVLLQHPSVADAGCVGVIREHDGEEIPKAFVVLKPGVEPCEELEDDIKNFVEDRVAPYKKVRVVEFIEEIPKSATGKILRRKLKEI